MGCCYSFFYKNDVTSQSAEINERTHLLVDPVSNNSVIQRTSSDSLIHQNINSDCRKTDEQSALNKILQETATNVIDVAALDSNNLQQHEYAERIKVYNQRVHQVCVSSRVKLLAKLKHSILNDIPNCDKILQLEPIASDNINHMAHIILKAVAAVSEIKVQHKEDLVVPFYLPG